MWANATILGYNTVKGSFRSILKLSAFAQNQILDAFKPKFYRKIFRELMAQKDDILRELYDQ